MSEKKKHRVIIGIELFLLCMIIATLSINATSANPLSNGVSYNKNNQVTVQNALDDLYNKANYGNASAGDILSGKTALVGGKKVTGTYEAPSLSSLTPGDAIASNIDVGKIAWVNGEKIVGTGDESLKSFSRLGDYVNYTPSSTSYTISSSDTGYKEDRKFNPSELDVWRIIRKNSDGTVEMVSVDLPTTGLVFSSNIGYKNFIGVLNKVAKAYETEGITVGSRHVGYDGTAIEYCTDIESCPGDEGYKTDLDLLRESGGLSANYKGNTAVADFITYWVASRQGGNGMYARCIYGGAFYESCTLSNNSTYSKFVRPIVILAANVKFVGGDGSVNTPYVLGK